VTDRRILIIAGPNGAGKTTFARQFLPQEARCPVFVNADLIAAGLSPFEPEKVALRAGRLMARMIGELALAGESFGFETTLAGTGYARKIPLWQRRGYRVSLFYVALASPELAIARVAERVRQGGHNVPQDVIRRRFEASRRNFEIIYRSLVDAWSVYDNSGEEPSLLGWGEMERDS
jgi:predicted ABC-type ATPase